jgi:hypothetical protein
MKDVAACDKLRGGGKQPLIRGFPNGETYPVEDRMSLTIFEYKIKVLIKEELKQINKN